MSFSHATANHRIAVLTVSLIVLVSLALTGQLFRPYMAHDDLPFIYGYDGSGAPGAFWNNTLTEGRWLTWLWSYASLYVPAWVIFIGFHAALIGVVLHYTSKAASLPVATMVLGVLLVVSNSAVLDMQGWTVTLFPGAAVCLAHVLLGDRVKGPYGPALDFVGGFLAFQNYPGYAVIVLASAVVRERGTLRATISSTIAVAAGIAASLISSFALNLIHHGYFGVKIAAWRNPFPVRSVADAWGNLQKLAPHYRWVFFSQLPSLLMLVTGLFLASDKARLTSAVPFLFGASMDLVISISTGVIPAERTYVWVPFTCLLPWVLCPLTDVGSKSFGIACAALCAPAVLVFYDQQKAFGLARKELHAIAQTLAEQQRNSGPVQVLVAGTTPHSPYHDGTGIYGVARHVYKINAVLCAGGTAKACSSINPARRGIYRQQIDGAEYLIVNTP